MKLLVLLTFFLITNNILWATNFSSDVDVENHIKKRALKLFEDQDLIEITVNADFDVIRADRDRATNTYHEAEILYGDAVRIPVKLKTRGNFRLRCENCDFPPLRFKFKPKETINTVFEGQDKLKLVTHCRDTSDAMQQAVLREYLVYKLYNTVTDSSFRVRLAKVNYVNITTGDVLSKYAFFIESGKKMAGRLGLEKIEVANMTQQQLASDNVIKLALFNYMIGNTDWAIPKLHNVELLRDSRHSPPIAIPYDFDMSEFVNTSYMHMYMGRELEEDRYKGIKVSKEMLDIARQHYQERKVQLVNVILDFNYLNINAKQRCLKNLDSFYKIIDNKQASRKIFITESGR